MKRCIVIVLCIMMISFCSCTAHENAMFIEHDDGMCVLYQEQEYFAAPGFSLTEQRGVANADDVELGWYYSFPFSTDFYSDTSEEPVYIYTIGGDTNVYFRQDYLYQADTFCIAGTQHEFVFSDALTLSDAFLHTGLDRYPNETELTLYSKQYPRIQMPISVFCVDDHWYVGGNEKGMLFEISDEFVKLFTGNT